jgi:hypothetical protein
LRKERGIPFSTLGFQKILGGGKTVKNGILVTSLVMLLALSLVVVGCPRPVEEVEVEVPQEVIAGLGGDPGVMYGYGAHPPLTRALEPLVFSDDVKL